MIFHWEYILFPIILLFLIALILGIILTVDLSAEDQSKSEIIKAFIRQVMTRLHLH